LVFLIHTELRCTVDHTSDLKDYNQQISTLSTVLTYNWNNTFTIHVSDLSVKFLLFINSQLKTNDQNIVHLNQRTHGHVRTRSVAPFQWFPGSCERSDGHNKMCWWSVSSLSIADEALRSGEKCWTVPRKTCWRTYISMKFSPFSGVGNSIPEVCRSILDTLCIYISGFHYMTPRKHDIRAEIVQTRWLSPVR